MSGYAKWLLRAGGKSTFVSSFRVARAPDVLMVNIKDLGSPLISKHHYNVEKATDDTVEQVRGLARLFEPNEVVAVMDGVFPRAKLAQEVWKRKFSLTHPRHPITRAQTLFTAGTLFERTLEDKMVKAFHNGEFSFKVLTSMQPGEANVKMAQHVSKTDPQGEKQYLLYGMHEILPLHCVHPILSKTASPVSYGDHTMRKVTEFAVQDMVALTRGDAIHTGLLLLLFSPKHSPGLFRFVHFDKAIELCTSGLLSGIVHTENERIRLQHDGLLRLFEMLASIEDKEAAEAKDATPEHAAMFLTTLAYTMDTYYNGACQDVDFMSPKQGYMVTATSVRDYLRTMPHDIEAPRSEYGRYLSVAESQLLLLPKWAKKNLNRYLLPALEEESEFKRWYDSRCRKCASLFKELSLQRKKMDSMPQLELDQESNERLSELRDRFYKHFQTHEFLIPFEAVEETARKFKTQRRRAVIERNKAMQ